MAEATITELTGCTCSCYYCAGKPCYNGFFCNPGQQGGPATSCDFGGTSCYSIWSTWGCPYTRCDAVPMLTTTTATNTTTSSTTTTSATTTMTTTTTLTSSVTAGQVRLSFGDKGLVPRATAINMCQRKGKHLCTDWELLDQQGHIKGQGCLRKMKLWTSSTCAATEVAPTLAPTLAPPSQMVTFDGCSKISTSCEPPEAHAMFLCCDGPAPPGRRLRDTEPRAIPTVLV